MQIKQFIRNLAPRWLLSLYHYLASYAVAMIYGFPGRSMPVIGITGTKGKTTTANMVWHILQTAGFKTGLISTAQFAVGQKVTINDLKMTMPSRRQLQRRLREMKQASCQYVVLETSSEGLAQWRQLGIYYQIGVLTNLSPEHIESHGSFENYRAAKTKLFGALARTIKARRGPVATIINLDDPAAAYYLQFKVGAVYGYSLRNASNQTVDHLIKAEAVSISPQSATVKINNSLLTLAVGGEFNVYNALAAATVGVAVGLSWTVIIPALHNYQGTPGRMEFINQGQSFYVVVDYAHTANSLAQVYRTLRPYGRLLAVIGSCGGGRDKAKRPILGRLAAEYAAKVWVTNEDPYDEDPAQIMSAVAEGAMAAGKIKNQDLFIINDRREAIQEALKTASKGDIVVITGKGSEQWLCIADNQKIPWDDRLVVKEELAKIGFRV